MKKMTRIMISAGLTLAVSWIGFTSCETLDDPDINDIDGIYIGAFSTPGSLKSALLDGLDRGHGTTEVTMMGDNQIEVHCFGEEIDTTFMLGYYEHNDSVMVCLTGDDFTNMYGHSLGEGHMSGGMMGHMGDGETEWLHHMDDEHLASDDHFGGFDLEEGSFTYSFKMQEGASPYYLKFHGVKE